MTPDDIEAKARELVRGPDVGAGDGDTAALAARDAEIATLRAKLTEAEANYPTLWGKTRAYIDRLEEALRWYADDDGEEKFRIVDRNGSAIAKFSDFSSRARAALTTPAQSEADTESRAITLASYEALAVAVRDATGAGPDVSLSDLADRVNAQTEALRVAEEALKPFAVAYDFVDDRVRGEGMMQPKRLLASLKIGHFRKAERALASIEKLRKGGK